MTRVLVTCLAYTSPTPDRITHPCPTARALAEHLGGEGL